MGRNDERFPKSERLLKRSDFRQTQRRGERATSRHFIVYGRPNSLDFSRLGLTLSRKVGNAVRRNRYKRRLREVFRLNKASFPAGYDYVVIVRRPGQGKEPAYETLERDLIGLLRKASKS